MFSILAILSLPFRNTAASFDIATAKSCIIALWKDYAQSQEGGLTRRTALAALEEVDRQIRDRLVHYRKISVVSQHPFSQTDAQSSLLFWSPVGSQASTP